MQYYDDYGELHEVPDYPDQAPTGDPYHDPGTYAGAGPPTPGGGYGQAPIDTATGRTAAGWEQGEDGGYRFNEGATPGGQPGAPGPTGGTLGNYASYKPTAYGGPMRPDFGNLPGFPKPPQFQKPKDFIAPTYQDAFNDPGYQFSLGEGRRALEQSAAGKGQLRTGGTLKDIIGYGQNMAQRQYGDVYDRRLNTWEQTEYNPALAYYGAAMTGYAPEFDAWKVDVDTKRAQAEDEFNRQYQEFTRQQTDQYNHDRDVLNAGSA
jgi:hypothetical protein